MTAEPLVRPATPEDDVLPVVAPEPAPDPHPEEAAR